MENLEKPGRPAIITMIATLAEEANGYRIEDDDGFRHLYAMASRTCEQCGRGHGELSQDGERTLNKPDDEPLCSDCWANTEPSEDELVRLAAPDLLAALENLLAEVNALGWGDSLETHDADTAIDKARGIGQNVDVSA